MATDQLAIRIRIIEKILQVFPCQGAHMVFFAGKKEKERNSRG